jgi:hypothetical protein
MGHLKNKSELNLGAAELLHQYSYYSSVVHCAYYSCIQLMKHTWLNSMGKSDNDLRNLKPLSAQENLKKSNKFGFMKDCSYINDIEKYLKDKSYDKQ